MRTGISNMRQNLVALSCKETYAETLGVIHSSWSILKGVPRLYERRAVRPRS
jgi:hypothetical protein